VDTAAVGLCRGPEISSLRRNIYFIRIYPLFCAGLKLDVYNCDSFDFDCTAVRLAFDCNLAALRDQSTTLIFVTAAGLSAVSVTAVGVTAGMCYVTVTFTGQGRI